MATIDRGGRPLELNEEGFLVHPEEWDEELALLLARAEEDLDALDRRALGGHPLHPRSTTWRSDSAPMVRAICKTTGLPLKRIYELFPSGPAKGACKLAGLPKPDGCV